MDTKTLLNALPSLSGRKVVVVGDLFLDEYLIGRATRLSREAPVPVLEFSRRFHLPGGACNPANNIASLGGMAYQVGVIGKDEAGHALLESLGEARIDTSGVVVDAARPTTTKTRVVAEGTLVFSQQLARIDRVDRNPLKKETLRQLLVHLERLAPQVDAVLLSDYKAGVVNEATIEASLELAGKHNKVISVDSQGDLYKFLGFDLVKCNRSEAEQVLKQRLQKDGDFEDAGKRFLADLKAGAILITRGVEGLTLITGKEALHIAAANRSEVFDVTGAGDTVIAVATLALAAGLDLALGARLANYAAGLVVRRLGNVAPTQEELAWAIENW